VAAGVATWRKVAPRLRWLSPTPHDAYVSNQAVVVTEVVTATLRAREFRVRVEQEPSDRGAV